MLLSLTWNPHVNCLLVHCPPYLFFFCLFLFFSLLNWSEVYVVLALVTTEGPRRSRRRLVQFPSCSVFGNRTKRFVFCSNISAKLTLQCSKLTLGVSAQRFFFVHARREMNKLRGGWEKVLKRAVLLHPSEELPIYFLCSHIYFTGFGFSYLWPSFWGFRRSKAPGFSNDLLARSPKKSLTYPWARGRWSVHKETCAFPQANGRTEVL